MSKLSVYDMKGAALAEVEFPDALLVSDKGEQAVHDVIVAYQAGARAGTASTLGKGAVAGSGKKPWKQKGTGRARAGYRQSPVWRGGGVAFGPHPRSYAQSVPRKVARLAFRRAFSARILAGEVRVLEDLALAEPKTKLCAALLKSLGLTRGALIVVAQPDAKLVRAARNLPDVEVTTVAAVNTYQLLRYPVVVMTRAAMDGVKSRLEASSGRVA
jgi:large subunit ribosomal protein L4